MYTLFEMKLRIMMINWITIYEEDPIYCLTYFDNSVMIKKLKNKLHKGVDMLFLVELRCLFRNYDIIVN